jgi:hypothetical protein
LRDAKNSVKTLAKKITITHNKQQIHARALIKKKKDT